ncbi:MAG: hypothetical protein IJJ33_20210 [Victivallales bacterium]|nr:hypothetical protein [Victivallales bacterium]
MNTDSTVISPRLFGQNLEHTRAAIQGGLSAQLLRNRKFAGKPSMDGVASEWSGYGEQPFFELLPMGTYTRHYSISVMPRRNEVQAQYLQGLDAGGMAGLRQGDLPLRKGQTYRLKVALKAPNQDKVTVTARVRNESQILLLTAMTVKGDEWQVFEESFAAPCDCSACLELEVAGRQAIAVGMASLLPSDAFRGMRRDVVEALRCLGVKLLRWPGGNYAGEYRWDDGLIPADQRAPIQSYMENETHTYTHGFDSNDLCTDDFIALCRELGAEPSITLNLTWDTPERSAAWVEYCNGAPDTPGGALRAAQGHPEPYNVKLWSLGNEPGYGHMEGAQTPQEYAPLARRHAEAMLAVDSSLELTSAGPYPLPDWVEGAGRPLADLAPMVSLHCYNCQTGRHDFTTPENTSATIRRLLGDLDNTFDKIRKLTALLPSNMSIAFDEWNIWYSWFREVGIGEGLAVARLLTTLLNNEERWPIRLFCYYQAINEGAIRVSARECHLTASGQALQMFAPHAGGALLDWRGRLATSCASRHANRLHFTAYNPDLEQPLSLVYPPEMLADAARTGGNAQITLWQPDGLGPASRFSPMHCPTLPATIPPLHLLTVSAESGCPF